MDNKYTIQHQYWLDILKKTAGNSGLQKLGFWS